MLRREFGANYRTDLRRYGIKPKRVGEIMRAALNATGRPRRPAAGQKRQPARARLNRADRRFRQRHPPPGHGSRTRTTAPAAAHAATVISGPGPGAAAAAQAAARRRQEAQELRRRQQAARLQHGFAPPTQRAGTRQGLGPDRPTTSTGMLRRRRRAIALMGPAGPAKPTPTCPSANARRSASRETTSARRSAVDRFLQGRYNLELGPRAGGTSEQRLAAARLAPKLAVNEQIDTARNRAERTRAINALSGPHVRADCVGGLPLPPEEEIIYAEETTPGGPSLEEIKEYRQPL